MERWLGVLCVAVPIALATQSLFHRAWMDSSIAEGTPRWGLYEGIRPEHLRRDILRTLLLRNDGSYADRWFSLNVGALRSQGTGRWRTRGAGQIEFLTGSLQGWRGQVSGDRMIFWPPGAQPPTPAESTRQDLEEMAARGFPGNGLGRWVEVYVRRLDLPDGEAWLRRRPDEAALEMPR